jgi:hypothetical protein
MLTLFMMIYYHPPQHQSYSLLCDSLLSFLHIIAATTTDRWNDYRWAYVICCAWWCGYCIVIHIQCRALILFKRCLHHKPVAATFLFTKLLLFRSFIISSSSIHCYYSSLIIQLISYNLLVAFACASQPHITHCWWCCYPLTIIQWLLLLSLH